MHTAIGVLDGEESIRDKMLALNGIRTRYYAQSPAGEPQTVSVYDLAAEAVAQLSRDGSLLGDETFLSAGTTYGPLAAPGIASLLHDRAAARGVLDQPVEISSHSGICSSSAAAFVAATRAVASGEHTAAVSVGAEHASESLKASRIQPIDDRNEHDDVRQSQWFMCVFLRFMLSDGAGAFRVASEPTGRTNWEVEWTESRSMAHANPLCMQVESHSGRLTQDPRILASHLFPAGKIVLGEALSRRGLTIDDYDIVLPHLSSFYFRRKFERMMSALSPSARTPDYWTNLETVGNTGAASLYLLVDGFRRTHTLEPGQRVLVLVPESGQFNFVVISMRAGG